MNEPTCKVCGVAWGRRAVWDECFENGVRRLGGHTFDKDEVEARIAELMKETTDELL